MQVRARGGKRNAAVAGKRYTIVTAVYNVARYLPDFIASIEQQTHGVRDIDVIAVDDGSTDDSLEILNKWSAERPELVTVLTQPNAGQGAARNRGLLHARTEWVTFTDPDDVLDANYVKAVDAFVEAHPAIDMVAANRMYLDDTTGAVSDTHWLRHMFVGGDRAIDLNRFPTYFHGHVASAFMRTAVLQDRALRFDERIRPNFEDGHFCIKYLEAAASQVVGFVRSAEYYYRRRADRSSTLQTSLIEASRFTAVPKYGYLDVLTPPDGHSYVSEWIQNYVLYELSWYFSAENKFAGSVSAAHGAVGAEFVALLQQIARRLDPLVIEAFRVRRFDQVWREILLHFGAGDWHSPYIVVSALDRVKGLARLEYRYVGTPPEAAFLYRGLPTEPVYDKVRSHDYFGQSLMYQRIVWVRADGTLSATLDGVRAELRRNWPGTPTVRLRPSELQNWFRRRPRPALKSRLSPRRLQARLTKFGARTLPVRYRFRNAWVLMDRVADADDNAERVFRYLRKHRRDINAWFVIEKDTPDFERLKADRYGRRVVPHGSLRWKWLMLNCRHLVSSHIDASIQRPSALRPLGALSWKFTFLQHGVIKDDISRWLNTKSIDLFVTSSPREHESIVEHGSPYIFTAKEVKMTGLPRFDRLLELDRSSSVRDLILVCPTWRDHLSTVLQTGSHGRAMAADLLESQFAREWLALLGDTRLRAVADRHGLRIGFLPHPTMQPMLDSIVAPDWVEILRYGGTDIQALVCRAAVMVTDYSSMSFNAAYIERPVVYFQFDAEQVLRGGHLGREGYFDYRRDGFGPVTENVEDAVDAVAQVLTDPDPLYERRMRGALPLRDGRCCERVVAAIEDTGRPWMPPADE